MKPLIGIPPDTDNGQRIPVRSKNEFVVLLWGSYLQAILDHGGIPVVLPVTDDKRAVIELVARLDGVLIAGGAFDVPPSYYGEKTQPWCGNLKPARSALELMVLQLALKKKLPVLGICGGLQIINVALGGSLHQDIQKERPGSINHQQPPPKDRPFHEVKIFPATNLEKITGARRRKNVFGVNSTHHQAVKDLGRGLRIAAVSPDGLIEAVESPGPSFLLGLQWHPELLYPNRPDQSAIFKAFIRAARGCMLGGGDSRG
jgi:putative glutamine amidotransferase